MSKDPKVSNAALDLLLASCNGKPLKIWAGTVPADSETAITGQTLLGTFTMGSTAFAAAGATVAKKAIANAIAPITAVASGTPSFFRVSATGTVGTLQGTVGNVAGASDLVLDKAAIVDGDTVSVVSFTVTRS